MNDKHYIYLLTCNDGLHYVGVSKSPRHRICAHLSSNGSRLVKEAIENGATFTSQIIDEGSFAEIYNKERYYINQYNSLEPNGYNLDEGGRAGGIANREGSNNTQAVLNEELVLEIREIYSQNIKTQQQLASIYKVSRENISAIVRGKSWSNIGGPRTIKLNADKKVSQENIDLIRFLRLEDKLTYQKISEELSIPFSTVAKYAKGY